MASLALHGMTFTELLSAFLDISIAFLLLCASTLAYFTSKFLGFFCLYLPCLSYFQRLLFASPLQKTSLIQSLSRSKFLSGSNSDEEEVPGRRVSCTLKRKLKKVLGGEELARLSENGFVVGSLDIPDGKEGNFAFNGKVSPRYKARLGVKYRRRCAADNGTLPFSEMNKPFVLNAGIVTQAPPANICDTGNDAVKEVGNVQGCDASAAGTDLKERVFNGSDTNTVTVDENKLKGDKGSDFNSEERIRELEQALEQEHAARALLYVELEKERCAASSAADEAMAMISRLQEEKAAMEMESRQYQRMIEDKYLYDSEEMSLLKEILLRREREKYFLEKEVEAYRQMIFQHKKLNPEFYNIGDINVEMPQLNDNSMLNMMHQGSESIAKKGKTENLIDFSDSLDSKLLLLDNISNQGDIPGRLSTDKQTCQLSASKEKTCQELIQERATSSSVRETLGVNASTQFSRSTSPAAQKEVIHQDSKSVHVVRAIDDQSNSDKLISENKTEQLPTKSNNEKTIDNPKIKLPPTGSSRTKTLRSDGRRKSMSAFDTERLQIDSEINSLTERLRIVQEGRDKISSSVCLKEKDKIQLQILEQITGILRQTQRSSEPGKVARQVSLPLLTSKVVSKKRRWPSGTSLPM